MKNSEILIEGIDFYYDPHGLMVFTEAYHEKRGHCCQSGCRHCPYGYRKLENCDDGQRCGTRL